MEPALLQTRDERGLVTLTMNRPANFNALSEEMLAALQEALDGVARDDSARVVVLAASGKAFCPGQPANAISHQQAGNQRAGVPHGGAMVEIADEPAELVQPLVVARIHLGQTGFLFSVKAVTPSCAQSSIMFTAMVWLASWYAASSPISRWR